MPRVAVGRRADRRLHGARTAASAWRTSSTPATRSPSTSPRRSSSAPPPRRSPSTAPSRYDALFPDEVGAERRADRARSARRCARRFPREPEQDLLGFIEHHARGAGGLAARRDVDRARRAGLLPAAAAHEAAQRGRGGAVPPGDLPAPVPARRPLLGVRALNAGVVAAAPGPGQPVQPRHQRSCARSCGSPPSPTTRSASAGAGRARSDPFEQVRTVLRDLRRRGAAARVPHPEGVRGSRRLYAFEHAAAATRAASASPRARRTRSATS